MYYCVGILLTYFVLIPCVSLRVSSEKKKIGISLEGGCVGGGGIGRWAGFVLLREPDVGSVLRGENQNSWHRMSRSSALEKLKSLDFFGFL